MFRSALICLPVLALLPVHEASADPAADALAKKVMKAAGSDKYDQVRELRFAFVVKQGGKAVFSAAHRWDRAAHRARVEWTAKDGHHNAVIVDLTHKTGSARANGEPVTGEARTKLLEAAHARWINDTYWFVLPLKLFDPGVRRKRLPDVEGRPVIELSYDGVGLTPGDRYHLHIDPKTHRIVKWDMMLQGRDGPPRSVTWEDYRTVGPLTLAHDHAMDGRNILIEDTAALDRVDPASFRL